MRTLLRISVLVAGLAALLPACPQSSSTSGLVTSESGFDGAGVVAGECTSGAYGLTYVIVPYLDINSEGKTALVEVAVRQSAAESGTPLPVFFHSYYALDTELVEHWCDRGWAVVWTVHTDSTGDYPMDIALGNGNNEARAVFEWIRRQSWVDRTHIHIDGISQGGYVALELSADMFPVISTTADMPPVNWDYNLEYVQANKGPANYPVDYQSSPLPLLEGVTGVLDSAMDYFGSDFSTSVWYYLSPISYANRITNPVLITSASGDMLVPMEQMSRTVVPFDAADFPGGYVRDFDTLTFYGPARAVLEEVLSEGAFERHVTALPEDAEEIIPSYYTGSTSKQAEKSTSYTDKWWSSAAQWSLLYLNEGAPKPYSGHTRYAWSLLPNSFTDYYQNATPSVELLNAGKLLRLMERLTLNLSHLPVMANYAYGNRLNFPALEQRDVLVGLLDYANLSAAHEEQLISLYAQCAIQPFGSEITLQAIQAALDAL